MTNKRIENLNIKEEQPIITPEELKNLYPLTENVIENVATGQETIKHILDKKDHRMFVVVGPCSIHDIEAAKDYARRLKKLSDQFSDTLYLVMRVYFEKPRTTTGWQGLITDPDLNGTNDYEKGLKMARELLIYVNELGLPTAGEALDIVTPQYVQDLISYTAIGARTTESQSHRKMASGFTSAIGFKNGTDGSLNIAINAMKSASNPNSFISVNPSGNVSVIRTNGNKYSHIILRGGIKPNYSVKDIKACEKKIESAGFEKNIMIDCSHANSNKNHRNQSQVIDSIIQQIESGNKSITSLMLESNLNEGNQPIPKDLSQLEYGVSVTDACIDWKRTETLLRYINNRLKDVLPNRIKLELRN